VYVRTRARVSEHVFIQNDVEGRGGVSTREKESSWQSRENNLNNKRTTIYVCIE